VDVGRNNQPLAYHGREGQEARFGSGGGIREIRDPKRGMVIQHGLRPGERRIESEQNGRRLVSTDPHRGYMERAYLHRNGHDYVQRTYWEHGRPYARVYRDHFYRGVHYYHYVPPYYYHPGFYGWAYEPWPAPVAYQWGWNIEPWYGYYGSYFAPAPIYPTASLWLTDFLLAENLKLAYEAKKEAEVNPQTYQPGGPPPEGESSVAAPLSPEVKAAIQVEVSRQLADEEAEAKGSIPPVSIEAPPAALDPKQRLFVVSSNLAVSPEGGQECELSGGDVITRIDDTPDPEGKVRVSVLTSKQNDCSVGSMPKLEASDLQEMHNSFREQLDSGLKTLASNQGKGGLPSAPDTGTSPGEVPPPAPDGNIDTRLQAQQKEATQTEEEVQQQVQTGQAPANP
jgi:hypothetical protein